MNFISSVSIENFRRFEQLEIKHINDKLVIMGANGSGKTTILWALSILLHAYNQKLKKNVETCLIGNADVSLLLNYDGLSYASVRFHSLFHSTSLSLYYISKYLFKFIFQLSYITTTLC